MSTKELAAEYKRTEIRQTLLNINKKSIAVDVLMI